MPGLTASLPPVDLDNEDAQAAVDPLPQSMRTAAAFNQSFGDFTRKAYNAISGPPGMDPFSETQADYNERVGMLSPEQANDQYGIDGVLRFNAPVTTHEAAWQSAQAQRQRFNDTVFARTNPDPLTDFGAGLAGSLLDPAGLAVMTATGGLGEAAMGGFDLARGAIAGARGIEAGAEAAAPAISTLGRLGNLARVPLQGAIDNVPFVGINAALNNASGDDYDMGDALRDIAAGAVLHTSAHLLFHTLPGLYRRGGAAVDPDAPADPMMESAPKPEAFSPNPVPAEGVPDDVDALPETARRGAFVKALDDMTDDRPVDVGQFVDRELSPPTLDGLDETSAAPDVASFRPLDDATAITTRGTEVPVRYGLAELDDLTTSHNDDLTVNPDFPPELQPRDRERAGAQARNYQLEQELNPKLLMGDVSAAGGAPIVSPDGIVESGNGRTIALRRSAAKGGAAYDAYKAELTAQGHDIQGMAKPVLVRMRTEPLTGSQRGGLAREMNADVTERMSVPEQAAADARGVDDAALSHLDGTPAGRRNFAKAFLQRVAPDQVNSLVAPDGALSKAGEDRIDAALTSKAYGDPRLVEALFEGGDGAIKGLSQALKAAAPAWAAMRSAIARGEVPAGLDMTEALRSAVDIVRSARDRGMLASRAIMELLEQHEMFAGVGISPETEAMLRLFFRPAAEDAPPEAHFTRPLASAKVAEALNDYARLARDYEPGPDLFGVTPDASTARQLLANLSARFASDDAGDLDILRPPGKPDSDSPTRGGAGAEARAPVLDVRQPGEDGGGRDRPGPPDGGQGAGDEGGRGQPVAGEDDAPGSEAGTGPGAGDVRPDGAVRSADALIAADPELRALRDDTDRLAADAGVEAETPENQQPRNLAEAVRAAAACLIGELE